MDLNKPSFFDGPAIEDLLVEPVAPPTPAPAAPPFPSTVTMLDEFKLNYATGFMLPDGDLWGFTGLMVVNQALTLKDNHTTAQPGTIFLFPGTYSATPTTSVLAYPGQLTIFNQRVSPLFFWPTTQPTPPLRLTTLHAQLINLLGGTSSNYIGFSARFPLTYSNVQYNSNTCNANWFGQNDLPYLWRDFVYESLASCLSWTPAISGQFYMCRNCGALCYFMKGMEKNGSLGACFGSSKGHWFTGSPSYALFGQLPGPIWSAGSPFGYQYNFRHCANCNGVFYGMPWGASAYCPAGTTSVPNHVATGANYYSVIQAPGTYSNTYYPGDPTKWTLCTVCSQLYRTSQTTGGCRVTQNNPSGNHFGSGGAYTLLTNAPLTS